MQQAFSLPWFVHVFPGRCPGLVSDEPFGLLWNGLIATTARKVCEWWNYGPMGKSNLPCRALPAPIGWIHL